MNSIKKYLKPHIPMMIAAMSIKSLGTVAELILPLLLTLMIDNFIPLGSISLVLLGGVGMALCTLFALCGNIKGNQMSAAVAKNTVSELRHAAFKKALHLSASQTDSMGIPSLISRITSDSYNVHTMLNMLQRIGIRAPILLIGGILLTMLIEWRLAMIMVALLPPIAAIILYITKKGVPLYTEVQVGVDEMVRCVRENVTGIRIIKALSKTEDEKKRFSGVVDKLVKMELNAGNTMAITNPLMNLFLNLGLTVVILTGAFLVHSAIALPGVIVGFLSYFTLILNAILTIGRIFMVYSKGTASANRIEEILSFSDDLIIDNTIADNSNYDDYHIVFKNVVFSYGKKTPNLNNINFCLKRGETLGIIGATGSGKSTLIQLLMRLYDVDEGGVYIDGRDVRATDVELLHKKFGVAFQNDNIFADTIAENVRFGRELTDEAVQRALAFAQADYVDNLPDTIEHQVAIRGANLSGGQRQRLLIARALVAKPEILILDDSSSALDYKTDSNLRAALKENFENTTKVIIAQRVSSILRADLILVMQDGEIIGQGTHEQLMSECESYVTISRSQMGEEVSA